MSSKTTVGVLAIQGSFDLHLASLERVGCEARRVRDASELAGLDGLIIPGGESTVMTGVTRTRGFFTELRARARGGLAMFGTCAGAILLGEGEGPPERLGVVPVVVKRNAYGRQVDSFSRELALEPFDRPFPGIFIRAPRVHLPGELPADLEILGHDGELRRRVSEDGEVQGASPVFLRHGRILLATFHPELTDDDRVHRYFVEECVLEGQGSPQTRR